MEKFNVDYIIEEKDFNAYADSVWNMLTSSYESLGGLKSYKGYEDFLEKQPFMKVVDLKKLIACATYRKTFVNSATQYKMTAIGRDKTKIGKEALQQIIKDDIHSEKYQFWVEASGVIEHYFEKFGGYKIHNSFAKEILGKRDNIDLDEDGFHYTRAIGKSRVLITKVIFGFANDSVFHLTNKQINNMEFPNGKLTESGFLGNFKKDIRMQIKEAYSVIEAIYQSNEEDDINELFPD